MATLAGISGREAVKRFQKIGYVVVRQRGSHVRMRISTNDRRPLTIPMHREIKFGLLRQLIKDAGMTIEDFQKL